MLGWRRSGTRTPRPPRRWTFAAAVVFALAVACELILTRGFLQAAAADSAAWNGISRPPAFPGLSAGVMEMAAAWVSGGFHPRHLEAWERSSLPVSALALAAFGLSFHLRRPRR